MMLLSSIVRVRPKWPPQLGRRLFHFGRDNWTEDCMKEIEAKWRDGDAIRRALPKGDPSKKPCYVLSMFPYPSGKLHMGHVRVYAISDAIAHYHRMQGRRVVHPMGWDSFGLPAENAAIEHGVKPKDWTESNIRSMRDQLERLGCTFDWERELSTCDPSYYRWTQAFFVRLAEAGLAYQREAVVNWDPVDQTVLADEQIDDTGRSWRSGAPVERRPLRQWFLRTTAFSKALYDGLDDPSLHNWRDITEIQRHWIGECTGTRLSLRVASSETDYVDAWTDSPEKLHQVHFVALAKGHLLDREDLVERRVHSTVSGCQVALISSEALHPFDERRRFPIVVFESTGTFPHPECDAYLATSDCDRNLAAELGLERSWEEETLAPPLSREEVMAEARKRNIGGYLCGPKLKDWLVSRQRYWGTPIPVIHCSSCGAVPVPEEQLPVELPRLDELSQRGRSPLLEAKDWIRTQCPKCGSAASRETDTMDTFVDSSWYFLRYLDPKNDRAPADPGKTEALPVDIYVGGKEHATLHLYYARFFTHFLHSIGVSPVKEPFSRLVVQGMVKAKSYRIKGTGEYLPVDRVDFGSEEGKRPVDKESGRPLVVEWEKMSKSKHNGVEPNQVLEKYGSDTVKMMMLSGVGPASDRNWTEDAYTRMRNLQIRLLKLVSLAVTLEKENLPPLDEARMEERREKLWDAGNYFLKGINHSYSLTHNLAIVLARIEGLVKEMWSTPGQAKRDLPEYHRCLSTAIITLAPIAPHLAAELWRGFCTVERKLSPGEFMWDRPVFHQLDQDYNLKLVIREGEEDLARIPIPVWKMPDLTKEEALEMAIREDKVKSKVLPHEHTFSFSKFPNFEACLDFSVKYPELTPEEKAALKEKKKEDKRRKKEVREKNILQRRLAEERKKARGRS